MIKVEYGIVTTGAKDKFAPQLENCALISNADDLSKENLVFKNFGNPCEEYSVLLDGGSIAIPENTSSENIGVWSKNISNEKGEFENEFPTITLTSSELFDIDGLSLIFDTQNNIYATKFSIFWYKDDELITTKEYEPVSPSFSLTEDIISTNKIVIVFKAINTPSSRLKVRSVVYGSILIIEGKSIKNMRIHQEVSVISNTIPISTLDLTFLNADNTNYNFTARQSLKVFNNDVIIGKYFIENAKQVNNLQWNIEAQDYINTLEIVEFEGEIYVDELAHNIITTIFNKANVPFTLAMELYDVRVTGYIPYTTCRKALQQVLFAIGAYASTSYSENVDILLNDLTTQESIGLERILTGQTISVDADITEIELVAHNYIPLEETIILYQSNNVEENLKIIFSEPVYELIIENGEIVESGTNYAIINCGENTILKGKKFEHSTFSKTKRNTTTSNKTINKKTIKNATLISSSNIDNILNVCYNYLVKNSSVKSKIIEGSTPIVVGKTYEVETNLLGKVTGTLTEQDFSIYGGNKIVKETVIR